MAGDKRELALTAKRRFKSLPGPKPELNEERDYASAGAPPEDSLKAIGWANGILSTSMFHIANDPKLEEPARRDELRKTARVIAALQPQDRILKAEQTIMDDGEALTEDDGPEMELAEELTTESNRAATPRRRHGKSSVRRTPS